MRTTPAHVMSEVDNDMAISCGVVCIVNDGMERNNVTAIALAVYEWYKYGWFHPGPTYSRGA